MISIRSLLLGFLLGKVLAFQTSAITVTTTNNVSPAAGEVSLLMALQQVHDGDEIRFDIPGAGPHYIQTPPSGYPYITSSNVTINGYSQTNSTPNTNSILAPNTAKIQIVLDSRSGGSTPMSFPLLHPNDDPGYDSSESAVLGVVGAQGVRIQGLSFLGLPTVGADNDVTLYFISFGRGASGQISGCWLGVDPDGKTVAAATDGITGFAYRMKDASGTTTNTVLVNGLVIGVAPQATNAVQQFNVLVGMPATPIIVEGDGTRISGNFITVLPDGLHDVDVALDDTLAGPFEGAVKIGRSGNNTVIGTDGDGVNDSNERNVFGGMVPTALGGYDHLVEFYSPNPGTNIVFAGNYVGIGVDGKTRFTNGVAVLNAAGAAAQYRIGSDFNGVSDDVEGNLIANNYPASLFPASDFQNRADTLSFLDQLSLGSTVSLRGNSLVNNFPFPVSPARDSGSFVANYYAGALLDPTASPQPVLLTNSTRLSLKGSVALTNPDAYSAIIVDVYAADPEGMTNGIAAAVPELPQGFVQGRTYFGSFPVPASAATNTPPGSFDVDVSKLNIPTGTPVTITANYIATSGGGTDGEAPSFTSINRADDGTITITWTSGTLQSAPALTGPWSEETATGTTFTTTATDPVKFFRLQAGAPTPDLSTPPLTSPFSNVVTVK